MPLLDRIFIVVKVLRCWRSINTETRIELGNSVSEEVRMLRSRISSASVCRFILLWFVLVAGTDEHLHFDESRLERSADAEPGSPAPRDAPLKTLELENMGDAFNTSAGKYTAHFKRRGKETEMRTKLECTLRKQNGKMSKTFKNFLPFPQGWCTCLAAMPMCRQSWRFRSTGRRCELS